MKSRARVTITLPDQAFSGLARGLLQHTHRVSLDDGMIDLGGVAFVQDGRKSRAAAQEKPVFAFEASGVGVTIR